MKVVPRCKDCKAEIINAECLCGLPEEDPKAKIYSNHCWNCSSSINSLNCVKSSTPGMGYHCNCCGKDLTEWKRRNYG
jgi:hypothetical protein